MYYGLELLAACTLLLNIYSLVFILLLYHSLLQVVSVFYMLLVIRMISAIPENIEIAEHIDCGDCNKK